MTGRSSSQHILVEKKSEFKLKKKFKQVEEKNI